MTQKSWICAVALLASACGPDLEAACNDYFDAAIACIDEAYAEDATVADTTAAALDGVCDTYAGQKGSAAKESAEILDCYATTYESGDCSTPEGYLETSGSITDCML